MTSQEAKQLVRALFLKTLPHLDVGAKMRAVVRLRDGALEIAGERIALHAGRPVRVIAMGKAALAMAHTLAEILDGVPLRGVVAAPSLSAALPGVPPVLPLPGYEYFAGGHPYPNEQSWVAAEAALALLDVRHCHDYDLVLHLVSGGGSSLMEKPLHGSITLADLRRFNEVLVTCGATIAEINMLRKRFSAIKGGRLAGVCTVPRQATLYVSDVPERSPAMIASGPTMPDESTLDEVQVFLDRSGLLDRLPETYRKLWESGRAQETPKAGDACFARSRYCCLLSNTQAIDAALNAAEEAGVVVAVDTSCDDWPLERAADQLIARLAQMRAENPGQPVAVISGGELSCPVTGDGMGGRNQAFVLDCARKIAGQNMVVMSAGTDGIDGNSPAAGAVADGGTLDRAQALGLSAGDYQRRSDSFHFFDKLGDTIVTGPTGTNVRDLRLLLAY